MPHTKDTYGPMTWWVQVNAYYQAGDTFTGYRWRLSYDDTCIADFDHEPTMAECMAALIQWWES